MKLEIKLVIQRDGKNNQAYEFSSYGELYEFADRRRDKESTPEVVEETSEEEVAEEAPKEDKEDSEEAK